MYLTVKEVAERLGVTRASVYIAIKDGRLRATKRYGLVVVSERDAQAYGAVVGVRNGYVRRGKTKGADPAREEENGQVNE